VREPGTIVESAQIQEYRTLRREIEQLVLPLATSIDGRRFTLQASLYGLALQVGGYVVVDADGEERLGQVLSLEVATVDGAELRFTGGVAGRAAMAVRLAEGEGVVLEGDGAPFHDGLVRPARADEVAAWLERVAKPRARLRIGSLAHAPEVPLCLDAGGFDRHTFLCGQSGSGKTYSLGLILEQLLVETRLRIVVLDPNSDYVRMGEVRSGVDAAVAARYRRSVAGLDVHRAHATGHRRLRIRLSELSPALQAALLRLDPVADREEHAEFDLLRYAERPPTMEAVIASERPEAKRLGMRVRNLGVDRFGVWARDDPGSTIEALHAEGSRGVVVDLGSLPTREEQSLTAAAVLADLWRRREERRPVLIVIDEAHNVCAAEPEDRLAAIASEHAVRIAAEGRKFGMYLLVSTQRPQKVHPNVVTQCDNVVLMRLNSAADAAYAQEVFSFVPPGLMATVSGFGLGEALVAGKICPAAALARFGGRVAVEGGADVSADWAVTRIG
jgi:DNA helicase HerA-like ATPase